jgi:CRT-like, chloroquine-resistance transporter-like
LLVTVFPFVSSTLVANRVFYKIQIAGAMADYTFFISLFTAACYVLIYFPVLFLRVLTRKVARSQIRAALSSHLLLFCAIGTLEALTLTLQMHAATRIPGSLLAILGQT